MNRRLFFIGVASAVILTGCHHKHEEGHDHSHDHSHDTVKTEEAREGDEHEESHEHSSDVIVLEPEKAEAAGVKADTITPGAFHGVITTGGKYCRPQAMKPLLWQHQPVWFRYQGL